MLIIQLIGGIGLFLLGMTLLTDGVKSVAGEALRRGLVRFTGTPLRAFASGALVTALIQSSTATTVTVIGFVSAGLLTFPQAVGVVFGASLGTTGTGWIVAVLGLKVSIGAYALLLVGAGAFLRMLGRGRWKVVGLAAAGFGLIFVGIDTLQAAMAGLSGIFNLAELPAGGFLGHVIAMVIGLLMAVLMQSSTAAIATTLTALHAGALNFEQAASIVIGAAIGTTITGALAAIGANIPAKRTALAHVLFNLATGLIAVALLPLFLAGIAFAQARLGLDPGATSLAAFHTAFVFLGVAMFLPFVHGFSRVITRLLPDRGPALTRHLDDTLLNVPAVALEATSRVLREMTCALLDVLHARLSGAVEEERALRAEVRQGLEDLTRFFARIPSVAENAPLSLFRVAQMHAIDHLARLESRWVPPDVVLVRLADERLQTTVSLTRDILALGVMGLRGAAHADWPERVQELAESLAEIRRRERPAILALIAAGGWEPHVALDLLDAIRWLDRVGYHGWRLCHYLSGVGRPEPLLISPTGPDDE